MRSFLKYTAASFVALILFVSLGIGGLIFIITAIASATRSVGPVIADKSMLVFDLSTEILDTSSDDGTGIFVQNVLSEGVPSTTTLRTVLDGLKYAATDDRIVGLYLTGNVSPSGLGSGFATIKEVRDAIQAFRNAGKPVIAYGMQWNEQDYYLVSAANTVVLNPSGLMELNGFKAETMFFAGALQKYGVGIQVLRAGQYKSAVEPFIRSDNSPQEEQQTRQLLSDLWNEFLTTTANSQQLTPQALQTIADSRGALFADEATAAGLIDKTAYFDEVLDDIHQLTDEQTSDEKSFRQMDLTEYAQTFASEEVSGPSDRQIAIVYAEGDIVSGEGTAGQVGGSRLAKEFRRLRDDSDVKAIVLRINSPGGSATASEEITREIMLTREVKPVIVSMGSYAASGGYMIAAYGNKIFASPNTITGSIGVFGLQPNIQKIANDNGITWDVVKTGQFADQTTITRPKTPQELAVGQRIVNRLYDRFLDIVTESRSLPRQKVAEIAQGRVWSGVEAQKLGLVDELGGLNDAIQAAAEAAELGDWTIEEYPKYPSLPEQILERVFSSQVQDTAAVNDPLTIQIQKLRADLETLKSMNDPFGAYTRLPFLPQID